MYMYMYMYTRARENSVKKYPTWYIIILIIIIKRYNIIIEPVATAAAAVVQDSRARARSIAYLYNTHIRLPIRIMYYLKSVYILFF